MEESVFMLTTDQKVVASYNLNNSFWFSEGKPIVAGKIISAFATAEKWQGSWRVKGAKVEYMVRCIWLTLQVHLSMDKFVRDGLKYNSAILAVFVRFLTKQTGSNVGLGFSGLISKLEERVKLAEGAVKEAVKKANKATTRVALASTAADLVKTGLAKLYTNNSLLKK